MKKVNLETSIDEVNRWMDYKKVRETKRESLHDQIESISEAFSEGLLVLKDDFTIEQTLVHPVGEDESIKSITYKPRLSDKQKQPHMKGVASNDQFGMMHAIIAALTNVPRAVVAGLDSEDMDIARAIAVFFA